MICQRCGKETNTFKGSFFNTEMICLECQAKEEAHPSFAEAKEAERQAVLAGDYNFPGIGKPSDL